MTKFIYLATPYSHKDAEVMEQRYEVVTEVAAAIMRATGVQCILPHHTFTSNGKARPAYVNRVVATA